MEKASKVMYTIANIFNWIVAVAMVALIILNILNLANVLPADFKVQGLGKGSLVYAIIALLVAIVAIILVRVAKDKNTSKGWDILFIVIGVLSSNIFYILGGIFGVVAKK